jgi:hypothetical protein
VITGSLYLKILVLNVSVSVLGFATMTHYSLPLDYVASEKGLEQVNSR